MSAAKAIHEEMIARGFERDRSNTTALRYTGLIKARGRDVRVAIEFHDRYLTRIPKLQLLNRNADLPNAVAHIEENDRVCYAREENLLLNPLNPKGSVALCLATMNIALDRIIANDLSDEIAQEFPQHWLGKGVYIDLPAEFSGRAALYLIREKSDAPFLLICESENSLRRFGLTPEERSKIAKTEIPIPVFSVDSNLTFLPGQRPPNTLHELMNWLNCSAPQIAKAIISSFTRSWPSPLYFLLHGPNGSVGGSLQLPRGLEKSIQRKDFLTRMLTSRSTKIGVSRITGIRTDADFIVSRNMHNQPDLRAKRVALVGIGTIGGFLAKFLAQSGAGMGGGQLVLIDEQIFAPGNIGRHYLGLAHVNKNKAKAMQEELNYLIPDCDVTSFPGNILDKTGDLLEFDLVVDATGEMPLSEVLNSEFIKVRSKGGNTAAMLHVWLAGNGVATQALLVDGDQYACFRCLRLDETGQERFRLLRPDHPVQITPANCGEGAYFAYGVGAPAIAAGLAIQMCLDWAKGDPSPRFRTIRIVNEATFEVKDSNVSRRGGCQICGTKH